MNYSLTCILLLTAGFTYAQQLVNVVHSGIPISVTSAAAGGSQIAAFKGDMNQISVNPALLDSSIHQNSSLTYLNYMAGINQASLSYAHLVDSIGLVSGYLRYLDYGTFTETDESGNEIGKFKSADYELGLSLSKQLNSNLSYGITFKQLFSNHYQFSSYGFAFDAGLFYKNAKHLTAALVIDNSGLLLKNYSSKSPKFYSPQLNFALTKGFAQAPIALGIQYNNLEIWDLAAADIDGQNLITSNAITGEAKRRKFTVDNLMRHLTLNAIFQPKPSFNLILGYNFRRRLELANNQRAAAVGLSFGAIVKVKKFTLQYAISSYHLGGTSNHLGVVTNINEWNKRKTIRTE
jgi:hypothetical protein